MTAHPNNISANPKPKSHGKAIAVRFIFAFLVLGLIFFLPAGTLTFWQAWVYIFIVAVPAIIIIKYLYKKDRKLLERRMRIKEKQQGQKSIVALSGLFFLVGFIIPGFDFRFHWSEMPLVIIIISDVLILAGYMLIALVFKTNSYASRIVEIEKGQKVITTGPYAVVRHPMYSGVLIFYIFSPLALGSYWAVIPALFMIPLIIARLKGEEKELIAILRGYDDYTKKTRHRLLPGIW
jgi:protein-S-isoprenylcysteine O-methyltransferase Ste14